MSKSRRAPWQSTNQNSAICNYRIFAIAILINLYYYKPESSLVGKSRMHFVYIVAAVLAFAMFD